jgi:hypothetical protein
MARLLRCDVCGAASGPRHELLHGIGGCSLVKNSPRLPVLALGAAAVLALLTGLSAGAGGLIPLSELELGAVAGTLAFVVFGIQGLISVAVEGEELRPGVAPPHLTNPLTAGIVIVSLLLLVDAYFLGYGIVNGWDVTRLGVAAGIGCLCLAALLIFYKEAFLGDEARFDDREDGVPW